MTTMAADLWMATDVTDGKGQVEEKTSSNTEYKDYLLCSWLPSLAHAHPVPLGCYFSHKTWGLTRDRVTPSGPSRVAKVETSLALRPGWIEPAGYDIISVWSACSGGREAEIAMIKGCPISTP